MFHVPTAAVAPSTCQSTPPRQALPRDSLTLHPIIIGPPDSPGTPAPFPAASGRRWLQRSDSGLRVTLGEISLTPSPVVGSTGRSPVGRRLTQRGVQVVSPAAQPGPRADAVELVSLTVLQ